MLWLSRAIVALAFGAVIGQSSRADPLGVTELATQIDRQIDTRLVAESVRPAEPADDAEFLRRVYLDLHGVIPTYEQTVRFLSSAEPDRRSRLVEELLASPRYGENLADIWQAYLISPLADDYRTRSDMLRVWLADRFNIATWDQIATELLTATGTPDKNPAVVYLIEGRLPRTVPDLTDLASRYFLGVRLSCAQCHDHPFVAWKQQDFWGMAAFFAQVQTPGRPKKVYQVGVRDDPAISLATLSDGGMIDGFLVRPPTFLGAVEWTPRNGKTNRAALAEWTTSPENPYFARAMVNRTWWRLFGRGFVNPVDDMHSANPASHPELLDLLTKEFIASGFNLKFLTRAITQSRAYQRTGRPGGESSEKQAALFGRMSVKVLTGGQLYDSLVTALGPPVRSAGKVNRDEVRHEFVQFFTDNGEPDPTAYRGGIPHLLRQMNSGQFAGQNIETLTQRYVRADRSVDNVANDLFLTILSRRPTEPEVRIFRDHAAQTDSVKSAARELIWTLTMTSEFSLNH